VFLVTKEFRIMPWLPKKSVVVPVDFSDESFDAIATALQLVARPSDVHVVHALPIYEPNDLESIWMPVEPAAREAQTLKSIEERLADNGTVGVTKHVVFGEAGHAIAEFAQKRQAELVVLPSHGRTGLTRLLIGSTAERVVRLCHCPVLVLRK
jgi:nucleotide-binding universal stress UspA family protein